jgi:hypothetical protein
MNKAKLKSYAPQARKDFIVAVTARAHLLGLDEQGGQLKVAPAQTQGDVTLIAGQAWPAKVDGQRQQLIARMQREGFAQTVEAVAYTWFNRFAALRYMELHDYLGHGHRALSSREGGLPEILAHASELAQAGDLPGLKPSRVNELKLAGNRDGELYRLLLIAQCNALHQAMPFLFERIDDETELLLPDNLLLSDSVIAKLVAEIPEEDWAEVEIIGWLYQFYISEKKADVIGKVVKSEDIPAATQLFTPNWIVQYLVQNSVGRLWLMANPGSTLASQWPYYIQPAEQTPEVQAQLDALIQTRVREDGETLNPETITVLDPACGSGHILVVAYDVLKAIYLERGYQPRAIPRLILEKNLYGLDIDDRAAQLAGFALLMKARADDRRLFNDPPELNVLSLQSSAGLNYEELCTHLATFNVQRHTIWGLIEAFEHAKTLGSLIQIPYQLKTQLGPLSQVLSMVSERGDLYAQQSANDLLQLVEQAKILTYQFDAVVANPPYMGSKNMTPLIKENAANNFPYSKPDIFCMFMERVLGALKPCGHSAFVVMQSWMFLSSYEDFRRQMYEKSSLIALAHFGARAFSELMGPTVQVAASVMSAIRVGDVKAVFIKADYGDENDKKSILRNGGGRFDFYTAEDFRVIPGGRLAYWITKKQSTTFKEGQCLGDVLSPRQGMATSDNSRFLRCWWEVSAGNTSRTCRTRLEASKSGATWFPYNKGGTPRKWYGNQETVVNWRDDGEELLAYATELYGSPTRTIKNIALYFKEGITWGDITFKNKLGEESFAARYSPAGAVFDVSGPSGFPSAEDLMPLLCLLNSRVVKAYMSIFNPTSHFQVGDMKQIPYILSADSKMMLEPLAIRALEIAKNEYEENELCPSFVSPNFNSAENFLSVNFAGVVEVGVGRVSELAMIETKINEILIQEYGLTEQLESTVTSDDISLEIVGENRYSIEVLSYAIGCTMGRYSLDEPGLIYAHAGNIGFDPSRYEKKFPADADGIVPLTDEPWFTDDAASRVREFLRAVWGPDTLEENMAWLAESLGVKGSETPDETIRRYLADKFFKDHLQTYKKRPIYWLFSSGKQGAFQALVYLHRYHEGTLARMRAEYVVPLTGKMQARLDMLEKDAQAATSTAARNKISKEIEKLKKKHLELLAYDEKLRHHADMRITLDLDDGVKVNYGKFGDLLAEVKAVTGGKDDE